VISKFLIYCAQEQESTKEVEHKEDRIGSIEGTGRGKEDGEIVSVAIGAIAIDSLVEPGNRIKEVVGVILLP
jgi:hypothetical protein